MVRLFRDAVQRLPGNLTDYRQSNIQKHAKQCSRCHWKKKNEEKNSGMKVLLFQQHNARPCESAMAGSTLSSCELHLMKYHRSEITTR